MRAALRRKLYAVNAQTAIRKFLMNIDVHRTPTARVDSAKEELHCYVMAGVSPEVTLPGVIFWGAMVRAVKVEKLSAINVPARIKKLQMAINVQRIPNAKVAGAKEQLHLRVGEHVNQRDLEEASRTVAHSVVQVLAVSTGKLFAGNVRTATDELERASVPANTIAIEAPAKEVVGGLSFSVAAVNADVRIIFLYVLGKTWRIL